MLANFCVKTPTEETEVCGQCHKHQPNNYIFSQYFHFLTDKDVFFFFFYQTSEKMVYYFS